MIIIVRRRRFMFLWRHSQYPFVRASFPWLWELFIPVRTQLPREHTCPAVITVLETVKIHKQSLSNQVPIRSWVKCVHIQVKCLIQWHSTTLWQPRPKPRTSQSRSWAQSPALNLGKKQVSRSLSCSGNQTWATSMTDKLSASYPTVPSQISVWYHR